MARLLVVDDDEAFLVVLKTILERANHEVFAASDGDQALEAYAGKGIDVVVTDLQMRNVHGLELISVLRDSEPRPGIIAISGTGEDQLDMAHALGADMTMSKPITAEQLVEAVASVLPERA